jgi:peptidoglycan hydrolase-like protein with peptidoglycan-binding domain
MIGFAVTIIFYVLFSGASPVKHILCAVALSLFALSVVPARAEYISYHYDGGVQAAQIRLTQLGYYVGKVDGINGPRTSHALAQFQRNNGLMVTGSYDVMTQVMLFPVYNAAYPYYYPGTVTAPQPYPYVAYPVTYAQPVAYAAQLPVQSRQIATTYAIPEAVRYGNYETPAGSPITTVVPRPW